LKNISTQKERISKYLEYKGISKNKFYIATGISNGTLDKKSGLTGDTIEKFYSVYNDISPEWLLTGEGSMLKDKNTDSMDAPNIIQVSERPMSVYSLTKDYYNQEKQLIPLYDLSASAGLNMLFSDQSSQIPLDYISIPNAPKCDGALSIRGDSMYPILKSGDIACYKIIRSFDDVRFGEMYILDIEDSSDQYLTAKYVQKSDKGDEYFKLVSENKYHADKDLHKSNVRALALIKMYIRVNTIS